MSIDRKPATLVAAVAACRTTGDECDILAAGLERLGGGGASVAAPLVESVSMQVCVGRSDKYCQNCRDA
jgi:hypothetical protein